VAGLLLLLPETSLQARVPVPRVTSLACGLFSATLPVLVVVPVPDVIVDDYGLPRAAEEGDAAPPAPAAG